MATWIVKYTDKRDAQDAMTQLQGYKLLGGNMILSISPEDSKSIVVKTNTTVRSKDLDDLFGRYGQIFDIYKEGSQKGEVVIITFLDQRDAEDAMRDMNGRDIDGRKIRITKVNLQPIIQIDGISPRTTDQDIVDIFERYGRVMNITRSEVSVEDNFYLDISKSFESLRDNPVFSDLTLVVSGREFSVHKIILSATSGYFRDVLESYQSEKILALEDIDPNVFSDLLDLIYGKGISLQGTKIIPVLELVIRLDVEEINFRELIPLIKVENNIEIYKLQDLVKLVYPEGIPKDIKNYLQNLIY